MPPAVSAALILPEVFSQGDHLPLAFDNTRFMRLLADMLSSFVAWLTHNLLLTIGVGMVA